MTVSSLASKSILSPNGYFPRAYEITRITPHHTAFVGSAEQIAACFSSTSRQASCNYAIGNDGEIICVVEEQNGSWCSSNWDNDNRAITVEISDADYGWNISPAAIEAYIDLCVDLIQRYPSLGGSYDWTGDLNGNVSLHRWFASTTCPGPYLADDDVQRSIMQEVNRRLGGGRYGVPMECIMRPDEADFLVYVSGQDITRLTHPDQCVAIDKVYNRANDTDDGCPRIELGTKEAPYAWRFFQACGKEDLYNAWMSGEEQPSGTDSEPTQSPTQSVDLSGIGEALAALGEALKAIRG